MSFIWKRSLKGIFGGEVVLHMKQVLYLKWLFESEGVIHLEGLFWEERVLYFKGIFGEEGGPSFGNVFVGERRPSFERGLWRGKLSFNWKGSLDMKVGSLFERTSFERGLRRRENHGSHTAHFSLLCWGSCGSLEVGSKNPFTSWAYCIVISTQLAIRCNHFNVFPPVHINWKWCSTSQQYDYFKRRK